ncbi:hypothetical protein DYBT9275_00744 [Dyadobacter sp. CECT 9275]|uniref:RagB/SusD family nutrient uptake outer membrane protein n=1 Tax=Dyadobacter helix TaxID=2822344 RepID=A0A916JA00_9BACT|nr:RagB/SusD family nutrient uptake outer membrane protein [Dyadobacter sp. CECT 9275]CAG4991402.1 hypothetical protein DYBT9275_00744 [Dyadobacter sp. CECT 9275]
MKKPDINIKLRSLRILVVLPTLLVLAGCEDFLSKEPDSTRARIETPKQVSQLLTTAYPQAGYVVFAESMTDNVADKGVGTDDKTNRFSFLFEEVEASVDASDSPDFYWAECYRAISVANQALKIIEESADPTIYSAQKGEALLARAYAHFMLVTFFSKFYNPQTASSDAGIPYVTEPETVVIKEYERKTVAYVFDMVEKDILAGLPLISDGSYTVPKYHFNLAAANAFAARFYLIKKDYNKVIQYANAAFPSNNFGDNMRPWNTTMQNMSPAELFAIYSKASQAANLLLVETASDIGRYMPSYRYGMSFAKSQEIMSSEGLVSSSASWAYPLYYRGDNNYFVPKWYEYFVRESVNADIGFPYVMLPLFTVEELLFNRAEANAYLGNQAAVLSDLNLFASKRISGYNASTHNITIAKVRSFYQTTNNTTGLINAILDFKRVEFLQEGMRWLDIQRYNLPVEHITRDGQVISIPADSPRRVLQIPQSAIQYGLEKNPR